MNSAITNKDNIMTTHKIVFGDSRSLKQIVDKSVQLIITSPPYWQLKDYEVDNQIGFNDSYEDYINNLNLVWQECNRVLSDGCRLCINIGDQFARSVYYGRYKVIPIRTEIIRFCESIGMDYMGAIIWQKTTTMNTSGGGAVMGSFPYPRNGILKIDYEFILIFKKPGNAPKPTKEQKELSIITKDEWNKYFSSHWHFNGAKQLGHIAMFPEELPKRLIKMFSYYGETVFDPFVGSGTTSLAAMKLGRNSIGYEINKDYKPFIEEKLEFNEFFSLNKAYITFYNDNLNLDFSYDQLPYVYHDPHKIDKKTDIKKIQFGSKIDSTMPQKVELYSVKNVISPEKLLLSNGVIIKLLGVKEIPSRKNEAIEYLQNKVKKRKVFMKYDNVKYDEENNLLCYLYLDNKTFINNHIIKTGLVAVETSYSYTLQQKFLQSSSK